MRTLMQFGKCSVFVMPDSTLRCNPFLGSSYLNPFREDLQEEKDGGPTPEGPGDVVQVNTGEGNTLAQS